MHRTQPTTPMIMGDGALVAARKLVLFTVFTIDQALIKGMLHVI